MESNSSLTKIKERTNQLLKSKKYQQIFLNELFKEQADLYKQYRNLAKEIGNNLFEQPLHSLIMRYKYYRRLYIRENNTHALLVSLLIDHIILRREERYALIKRKKLDEEGNNYKLPFLLKENVSSHYEYARFRTKESRNRIRKKLQNQF